MFHCVLRCRHQTCLCSGLLALHYSSAVFARSPVSLGLLTRHFCCKDYVLFCVTYNVLTPLNFLTSVNSLTPCQTMCLFQSRDWATFPEIWMFAWLDSFFGVYKCCLLLAHFHASLGALFRVLLFSITMCSCIVYNLRGLLRRLLWRYMMLVNCHMCYTGVKSNASCVFCSVLCMFVAILDYILLVVPCTSTWRILFLWVHARIIFQ